VDATLQRRAAAGGGAIAIAGSQASDYSCSELRLLYERQMRPFLERNGSRRQPIADRTLAKAMFDQLRLQLPDHLHPAIDDLENVCEEKRELDLQTRYHRILHGWLLVHIPLSYAVLLLGAIHGVVALAY